jgi:hypothetical protein
VRCSYDRISQSDSIPNLYTNSIVKQAIPSQRAAYLILNHPEAEPIAERRLEELDNLAVGSSGQTVSEAPKSKKNEARCVKRRDPRAGVPKSMPARDPEIVVKSTSDQPAATRTETMT